MLPLERYLLKLSYKNPFNILTRLDSLVNPKSKGPTSESPLILELVKKLEELRLK